MKSKHLLLSLLILIVSIPGLAQKDYIDQNFKLLPHPRILLLEGEEKVIIQSIAGGAVWGRMQEAILSESDKIISLAPLERIQVGRRLLATSREALRRI